MGKLIVLDGTDGAGKTTQTQILIDNLHQAGFKVDTVSFPAYDKTVSGKIISRYLKGEFGDVSNTSPYLTSYPYAIDRFESRGELLQKLDANDVVIATRYTVSNLAYQAAKLPKEARAEFRAWCAALDYEVFKNPKEDAVIFLSLPPQLSSELLKKRKSGLNEKDIHEDSFNYMVEVWQEYLQYCNSNPHCFKIDCYDADKIRSIESIANELKALVLNILNTRFNQKTKRIDFNERTWSTSQPVNQPAD